jgi:hypothetical protein
MRGFWPWHGDCSLPHEDGPNWLLHPEEGEHPVSDGTHINLGPGEKKERESDFFFMMNCLLYSRLETGHPSNQDVYDEDVNMYLAHLLTSFMNPDYHRRVRKYLSRYDSHLFEKIRESTDARLKYTIYKTNADFLLISIGIFHNPTWDRPHSRPFVEANEEACMGRGKTYYRFAYTYSQSLFRRPSAISEVLEKLSHGFERYVEILSHMRGEYLNILDRLSRGEIYHLERSIDRLKESEELKALQDRFLDLYSAYLENKDPELRKEIRRVVQKIQELDDSFRFSLDE